MGGRRWGRGWGTVGLQGRLRGGLKEGLQGEMRDGLLPAPRLQPLLQPLQTQPQAVYLPFHCPARHQPSVRGDSDPRGLWGGGGRGIEHVPVRIKPLRSLRELLPAPQVFPLQRILCVLQHPHPLRHKGAGSEAVPWAPPPPAVLPPPRLGSGKGLTHLELFRRSGGPCTHPAFEGFHLSGMVGLSPLRIPETPPI